MKKIWIRSGRENCHLIIDICVFLSGFSGPLNWAIIEKRKAQNVCVSKFIGASKCLMVKKIS